MTCAGLLVGFLLSQVPSPDGGLDVVRELEQARRQVLAQETAQLTALAVQVAAGGDEKAARQIQERIPRPTAPNGPTRFVVLPEVVPARDQADPAEPWRNSLTEIESRAAGELFKIAQKAAKTEQPSYALASKCLSAVLTRQPDHPEARRLMGFVRHQGGWATPFAVRKLKEGYVNHPTFGWVSADWVPHLDRGELPAPMGRGQQRKTRWLPAAEADNLRANWSPPWYIITEHFEIQTSVPLAEAISFGRRLEGFHELFMAQLADILGENLPLARRFKDPTMTGGTPGSRPHWVYYFASKEGYVDYLSPRQGPKIAESLGFYEPPKAGGGRRVPAYFFRDPGGQLPVTATLYHEVSHQLLFETAGSNAYTKNIGNYWVFEGLGTYFETVAPQPDGSLEVGGLVGRRIEEAIKAIVDQRRYVPLAQFVALDQNGFNREEDIYLHYQQAMALTIFFMQWHEGIYRDAFLDYVARCVSRMDQTRDWATVATAHRPVVRQP